MITAIAWSTPHHRLRRSLSSRRSLLVDGFAQLSLIAAQNSRTQLCPRGIPMKSAQGWQSQTKEEKQETNGGKLAFIRAVQAFPCHGGRWAAGGQGHSQFNSIDFHAKPVLWCFLDSRKYRPSSSPSFSLPSPHKAAAACLIAETCGCFFARNA